MTDVVHQNGSLYGLRFRVEDVDAFLRQRLHGFRHQVKSTQRVLEARMASTGIYHRCQSQLHNAVQSLKKRVLHNVIQQSPPDLDKPEHRVVNDFVFVHNRLQKYKKTSEPPTIRPIFYLLPR